MNLTQLKSLHVGNTLVYRKDGKEAVFEINGIDMSDKVSPVRLKLKSANTIVFDSVFDDIDIDNRMHTDISTWIYTSKTIAMSECDVSRRKAEKIIGENILVTLRDLELASSAPESVKPTDNFKVANIEDVRKHSKLSSERLGREVEQINRQIWIAADAGKQSIDASEFSKQALEIFTNSGYKLQDQQLCWDE